jgi:hypothetical protein
VIRRRIVAWSLIGPLALLASQAAHWLAYRLVAPTGGERVQLLATTGHGYLAYAPLGLGACTAVALLAFAGQLPALLHSPVHPAAPSVWGFAALAPLIFCCQELLERAIQGSGASWQVAVEPTFLLGLALQLPFAFVAYLCARLLLRAAEAIAAALVALKLQRLLAPRSAACAAVPPPRLGVLALGYPTRGPPVFLV